MADVFLQDTRLAMMGSYKGASSHWDFEATPGSVIKVSAITTGGQASYKLLSAFNITLKKYDSGQNKMVAVSTKTLPPGTNVPTSFTIDLY